MQMLIYRNLRVMASPFSDPMVQRTISNVHTQNSEAPIWWDALVTTLHERRRSRGECGALRVRELAAAGTPLVMRAPCCCLCAPASVSDDATTTVLILAAARRRRPARAGQRAARPVKKIQRFKSMTPSKPLDNNNWESKRDSKCRTLV